MNFIFSGNREELEQEILKYVSKDDVDKFINGMERLSSFFNSGDEFIDISTTIPETNPDVMELLIPDTNYNINLKAASIAIIAVIVDITLTKGFFRLPLDFAGFKSHAVVTLDEREGEKCLVLEILRAESRIIDETVLPLSSGECINNHLHCKYRMDGQCKIQKDDVCKILIKLCDKNVIREKGYGKYQYNW